LKYPETQSIVDLGRIDTPAATGAVTDTDKAMAYHKQNVTNTEAILVMLGGAAIQMRTAQSISAAVEENALQQFSIAIMDVDTGAVASANIDITGISAVIEKSTGGGAFSAAGLTAITFGKENGRVFVDYQFKAAEWTVGDTYKIVVTGIEATVGGDTAYIPAMVWSNFIVEGADLKTAVDAIQTDLGDFSARVQNLKSLLAVLGVPDADNDTLYKLVYTDMLAHADHGLANLKILIDANQTDLNSLLADVGDFSARTNNLKSLLAVLGVPDVDDGTLYKLVYTDMLASAAHGLAALSTDIGTATSAVGGVQTDTTALLADIGDFSGRTYNLKSLMAVLGVPDADTDTLYKLVYTDMLAHGTHGLAALDADLTTIINDLANETDGLGALKDLIDTADSAIDAVQTDLGNFSGQTYMTSLLTALGIPDTDSKPLYTVLVTDLLGHATHGLVQLQADIAAIPTTMVGTDNAFLASVGGALDDAAASGAVDDATTAVGYIKQLVTLLLDGTDGLAALNALIDTATTDIGTANTALTEGTYGLSALQVLIAALQTDLDNGTDGLGALKALLDAIPTTMVGTDDAALATDLATMQGNVTDILTDTGTAGVVLGTKVATFKRLAGEIQMAEATVDLNQAAADYDVFTGTTEDCWLIGFSIKMPDDLCSDTTLTSISVQTDDSTPIELIGVDAGAVANLTAEAELTWEGKCRINAGTKIQLTIAGGAEGAEYITTATAEYRAIADGGYLA